MIYKTPFYYAIEKGNIEIIKLLLTNDKVDINIPFIENLKFQIKFKYRIFKSNLELFI